jgi:hypothetical protein
MGPRLTTGNPDSWLSVNARVGEANVEFPHWLIICGGLLVFVGLIGAALKKRQMGADPVSFEQDRATGEQSISLPNFLGSRGSRDPSANGGT